MKNKPFVKTLFWVLFFFCTFQFALIIPTTIVERKAMAAAELHVSEYPLENQEQQKQVYFQAYLDSISNEVLFEIPYIAQYTYNSLKNRQLQLGLDLKGGMQITLGFDTEAFIKNLVRKREDAVFMAALGKANEISGLSHQQYVNSLFDFYGKMEMEENIIRQFSNHPQLKRQTNENTSVQTLEKDILQLSKEMIQKTRFLLEQRINYLGLAQTQITLDLDKQNIQIEIPGAKNPERIRKLLLTTAKLEFWETYRVTDAGIMDGLHKADRLLKSKTLIEGKN